MKPTKISRVTKVVKEEKDTCSQVTEFMKYKKCPKCGGGAEWQSKNLWLNYKGTEIWIGDYNIKLDKNMNGEITAWGLPKECGGCGHETNYKIIRGKLINKKII